MKSFFSFASLNNDSLHSVHGPRVASISKKTALASAIGLVLWGPFAYAETYTVLNTADSGEGSFRQAVLDANANAGDDTIIFDSALSNSSIAINSQINVTDNLTVTGLGQDNLTLLHNAAGDMLSLNVSTFAIEDITVHTADNATGSVLSNATGFDSIAVSRATFNNTADVTMSNAAIHSDNSQANQGVISISNSTLSGFRNGAILGKHVDVEISESTVSGNSSANQGGAVYGYRTDISISNSTINDNSSMVSGGAIHGYRNEISIADSTIGSNSSVKDGGAINGIYAYISISDSTISDNSSASKGSGIYIQNSQVDISKSIISNNFCELTNTTQCFGGGIYTHFSNVEISESDFSANTSENGGAIYSVFYSEITVSKTQFNLNSADAGNGGAIFQNYGAQLSVDQSLFMENTATGRGGAIQSSVSENRETSITGSSFISNNAPLGGAIYGFNERLVNCTFWGNEAESGGAIYTHNYGNIIALHSTFLNNTATDSGNELYIDNNFTIINSIVSANAEQGGSDNIYGTNNAVIQADYSLIGGSDNAAIVELTSGSNILNTSPFMAGLADNGGPRIGANSDQPILTLRPIQDSPVFDVGDSSVANSDIALPGTDQRGEGYPRLIDNAVNMGALETIQQNIPPMLSGRITDVNGILGEFINVNLATYFSDPEGAALTYTASGLPSGFGVSFDGLLTGELLATETDNFPAIITLRVSDGENITDATFNITLNNQAPILVSMIPDQVFTVGTISIYDFSVHFRDPELQTLSYSIEDLPSSLVLTTGGQLAGSLSSSDATTVPENYTLHVTDGGFTIKQVFEVSVVIPATPNSSNGSSGGGAFGFGWLFLFLGLGMFGRKRS